MAATGSVFRPKPPSLVIKEEKGRGSYGTVCVGNLDGKPVMIKRIYAILLEDSSDQLRNFEKECQILETLHHPNIVRSLGAYWDSATKEPLLLMEPMKENLREYLQRKKHAADKLSLDDHLNISLSIAEGLKFLHGKVQPIAHRDLNDKNILIGEDGSIKIGDFGQSALLAGSTDYMRTKAPGAFVFMPPEALMDKPHYNLKVDSFSMGVLMLEISTQMPPPARMTNIGSSQEIERRREDLDLLDSGHPLKPIIIWCLQNQYQLRPDVATIHSQLMSLNELEKTKDKLRGRELELGEKSLTIAQCKRENVQLENKLSAAHALESQLLLQLRQKESVLADKQALQKELERQLSEKDNEITVLNSDSEAKVRYARDSLRRLQDVPKFLDSIKAAVTSVSSIVETLEENCAEMDKRNEKNWTGVLVSTLASASAGGTVQPVVPAPRSPDVVEIPLEKTHRKMIIKKAHFIYEDADIKVAAICSELGFQTGYNKELDDRLKGQLSQATRGRYQHGKPGKFDVFTVHVQRAAIGCRYLVIADILDRSLETRHDGRKYLQQILQAVCQEADTLEMPSVVIAPSTFGIGGFQSQSVLPEFIHMLSLFKFTNDDFLTDVRFLANDHSTFDVLLAGAERAIGRSLRQHPRHTQAPQAPQQTHQPGSAGSRSTSSVHSTGKNTTPHPGATVSNPVSRGRPAVQPSSHTSHGQDVVEIPLEKTHRKMIIKKAHFIYEDADIKVAAICSELGFQTSSNKELDGHLKGQVSEAVRGRYQRDKPDRFDVFTVHVQHASINCCYLVIADILDRSLGTRHDGRKYLQQILQAVCQEADTLEMPSVAIAPNTFGIGGFQSQSVLPEFIHMLSQFKFTNDDFLTDVRFLANDPSTFDVLLAGAERAIGRSLKQHPRHAQAPQAPQQTHQPGSAGSRSTSSVHSTGKNTTPHPGATVSNPVSRGRPTAQPSSHTSHGQDVVEIPLEKTHRKMIIKKAHFIYEDADIKVAAICSELGFQIGHNKELDGHLKGQVSEAVRGRYQHEKPDKFDVFTVHVQHASINCRYLVIANILDCSLGTYQDGHKYLRQILQAVCQEADTLEMPSVAIALSTFSIGGFQPETILPAFIRMIDHFKFTEDDFLTDVRFLALDQNSFTSLIAGAERHVGKSLRKST